MRIMSICAAAATAVVGIAATAQPVFAQESNAGSFMVRARLLGVLPNESADITPINGDVEISEQFVPEVDFTYFITNNIAVELIAAVTPHEVEAVGTDLGDVDLGNVTLLPPTLTAQYHFTQFGAVKPYVGAGINYTTFFNVQDPEGFELNYKDSVGWALQGGVDYFLNENFFLNADIKYVDISPDVSINSSAVTAEVDIDPIIIGFGVGYKF